MSNYDPNESLEGLNPSLETTSPQETATAVQPEQVYVNNPVYSDPVSKPKKKRTAFKFFRKTVAFALIIFLAGGIFGGGYFSALYFGNTINQQLADRFGLEYTTNTNGFSVNKIQPIVSESTSDNVISAIAKSVGPSVVTITSKIQSNTNDLFSNSGSSGEGTGSGIIYEVNNEQVLIITNQHVIDGATSVEVSFGEEATVPANILGFDSKMDLAVLSVNISDLQQEDKSLVDALTVATFGDSDQVAVGELAVAIGNPMGKAFSNTITAGVVSAKDRQLEIENSAINFIQTDAAINPGNSGGALVNSKGEVIGINTAKYVDQSVEGMGFAIPSNQALPIIKNIISTGGGQDTAYTLDEDRAFLGVGIADIDSNTYNETGMPFGVYVTKVYAGSAADKAGIKSGDIIYSLDHKKVMTAESLFEALGNYKVGDELTIGVVRAEAVMELKATLTAYKDVKITE